MTVCPQCHREGREHSVSVEMEDEVAVLRSVPGAAAKAARAIQREFRCTPAGHRWRALERE